MSHRRPKNSKRTRKAFFSSQLRPSLTRGERLRCEEFEPRTTLDATPVSSEFLAADNRRASMRFLRKDTLSRAASLKNMGRVATKKM